MQSQQEVHETLVGLVEAHLGNQALAGEKIADQREEWRRPLEIQCTMQLFCGHKHVTQSLPAETRNVTFCGMAVVAACAKPVTRRRPVEIIIEVPSELPTHVAGTVAFCVQFQRGVLEAGFQVGDVDRPALPEMAPENPVERRVMGLEQGLEQEAREVEMVPTS